MNETVVDIYQKILSGDLQKFPRETWNPYKSGYDNFRRCLRFLILEKLNVTKRSKIIELVDRNGTKIISKYRLRGAVSGLYNGNIFDSIIASFPEHNFQTWEFAHFPHTLNTVIQAVKSSGIDGSDFSKIRSRFSDDKTLDRILSWYNTNYRNAGILALLKLSGVNIDRVCKNPNCLKNFTPSSTHQIYCTRKCGHRDRKKTYQQAGYTG